MYAMLENGKIVRTKDEAIEYAKRMLDNFIADGCDPEKVDVAVFRNNSEPRTLWFKVGYAERDADDYVQIKGGYKSPEQMARLDALKSRLGVQRWHPSCAVGTTRTAI